MKKVNLLLSFALIVSMNVNAQKDLPEVFESISDLSDWEMFENGGNDAENFVIVENPDKGDVNASDSCLMFTVVDEAQPWAGAVSTSFGDLEVTDDNHTMVMMVNKNVISRCLLKLEIKDGEFIEVFVENTLVDEWELLVFDFSAVIGKTYTGLVFFPDFPESRTEGSISYIDNIGWEGTVAVNEASITNVYVYPNPANEFLNVSSNNEIKSIHIIDIAGKSFINKKEVNNSNAQLNISNLLSGIYIVNIVGIDGKTEARKLTVK